MMLIAEGVTSTSSNFENYTIEWNKVFFEFLAQSLKNTPFVMNDFISTPKPQ